MKKNTSPARGKIVTVPLPLSVKIGRNDSKVKTNTEITRKKGRTMKTY
jgi:hypothetical protein